MGFMSLADFREETNIGLGDSAQPSNSVLDRWINRAYVEVVTKIEYEDLIEQETFDSVADQAMYEFPGDGESASLARRYLGIISIADLTNKKRLLKLDLRNYHLRDREVTGVPKLWARRGRFVYLWPTPDAVIEYELYGLLEPERLTLAEDITVIPAAWDHAIQLLTLRNAWITLRRSDEATLMHQAAMNFINQTMSDLEYNDGTPAMGLEIARSYEDLTDMRGDL